MTYSVKCDSCKDKSSKTCCDKFSDSLFECYT